MRRGLRMSELVQIAERRRQAQSVPARGVRFCSGCGEVFEHPGRRRVCPGCGMGVVLDTTAGALPSGRAAFVVVDRELEVTAVSAAGERLFGSEAAGSRISALLSARDGDGELGRQVARAASGLSGTEYLDVNVAGRRGAFVARISPCGPPRAALVAVERPRA